eukprot:713144_1
MMPRFLFIMLNIIFLVSSQTNNNNNNNNNNNIIDCNCPTPQPTISTSASTSRIPGQPSYAPTVNTSITSDNKQESIICSCDPNCSSSTIGGIFIGFIVLIIIELFVVFLLYYYKGIKFCVASKKKVM